MPRGKTACFSGYRPEKFTFPLIGEHPEYGRLLASIRKAVVESIDDGYNHFMVGKADGFDLIAATVFYELKEAARIPGNVRLTAVLPFVGHRPAQNWL